MENFSACFGDVVDPRRDNARHDLHELLVIALCAMLCGGEDCTDMALFGRAKEDFLRRFLRLRHGIPSHDTFSRLFRDLDPASFHAAFQSFMAQFSAGLSEVIAIDGKTLRRSFDRASAKSPLHLVSAWASEQRLVLGQIAVDGKSNEACPREGGGHRRSQAVGTAHLKGAHRDPGRHALPTRHGGGDLR